MNDLLARHGGNLRQCLNSLTAFGRLRHDLERRLAGLESRHPTVPPVAVAGKGRANPEVRHSNGEAAPGVVASPPPINMRRLTPRMMAPALMPRWTRRSMSGA